MDHRSRRRGATGRNGDLEHRGVRILKDRIATTVDDADLVVAAQKGDRRALDTLLRRHQDRLAALCRRMTRNDADAEDALQEALVAIVRGIERFDGRARFGTWAYRVTMNACIDELRRRKRRPAPGLPEIEGRPRDAAPSEASAITDRLSIDEALATISEEFRAAVVLRDVLGCDYAEIGAILEVPLGTVRSRIARGRAQLADALGNPPEAPDVQPPPP